MLVPQDIGDLLERSAAVEQPAGQRVTQDVYTRVRQACTSIGVVAGLNLSSFSRSERACSS